jgi:hypothetical protein
VSVQDIGIFYSLISLQDKYIWRGEKMINPITHAEADDSLWKSLYKVGAVAALTVLVLMSIQIVVLIVWPPPSTVIGWFNLFQTNKLVGLLDMDLLLIVDYALLGLVFLAFWTVLRRVNQSFMAIALVFELVGIATYFASTAAFEVLSLSNQYALAATDAERSVLLAVGQVMFAIWQGTAFNISYIISAIALLIVSVIMVRSSIFSKVTAYMGILASLLMFVPPTAGSIGVFISLISLIPTAIWLILIARKFFQLGRRE